MMGVAATDIVYVQRDQGMINESLKKFRQQIDIEFADSGPGKLYMILEARAAGTIHYHTRQRFIQGYVGVTIAADTGFIAEGLLHSLAETDTYILDSVVGVDSQVALRADAEIKQAMTCDLLQHVLEKRDADLEIGVTTAVKVKIDADPGLLGFPLQGGCSLLAHLRPFMPVLSLITGKLAV